MPIPLLSGLPLSARIAYPAIMSGVSRGLSSRAITAELRASGIRISRGRSVLPVMRAIRDLESQGAAVKFVSPANIINTRRLPPAVTELRRRYSYRVRVIGTGPFGATVRYINVATDSSTWTRSMIEDQAREFAEGAGDSGQLTDVWSA